MYFYCSKNSLSELIIFFSILSTFIIVQFCEEVAENQLLALFHPKQRLEWFSMWSHAQWTAGCWSFFRQSCNWLVASFRGDVQYQREEFQKLFRGYSVQAPHTYETLIPLLHQVEECAHEILDPLQQVDLISPFLRCSALDENISFVLFGC